MNPSRWLYRVRQFWHALTARPSPEALKHIQYILNSDQLALFARLQASEQAHALNVLSQLEEQGQTNPDLLVAALLHDVGKARHRLFIWDRVVVVLGRALFPQKVDIWGESPPEGWRRPYVIAAQHPAWGAEMAAEAGTSDIAVEIIRRHQDKIGVPKSEIDELLLALQAVDDMN
ncbi:MAG: HDIG domain-containing protein [Chloroflexi bacterium]|nr:MAG: HDIG domain-containing protein [Chloroflexota bacterium]MBL1196782.1 HDIG domain-containing protein [Chloroflexota bacterium]NOH14076.1 HDIG domain-containing protein [Chloroflexota bacterium]